MTREMPLNLRKGPRGVPSCHPPAWFIACVARVLPHSGAGDSRKAGSTRQGLIQGPRDTGRTPRRAPCFSQLVVTVVGAILEREKLPGGAWMAAAWKPQSPISCCGAAGLSLQPPSLASSGQMPHPPLPQMKPGKGPVCHCVQALLAALLPSAQPLTLPEGLPSPRQPSLC